MVASANDSRELDPKRGGDSFVLCKSESIAEGQNCVVRRQQGKMNEWVSSAVRSVGLDSAPSCY